MSRKFVIPLILIVLAIVGWVGFRQISGSQQRPINDLETALAERGTLVASVSASGRVEASRRVALTFKTPGRIADVYVEAGDEVEAGDPLATLDTAELELQVAQAQAGLSSAEAKLAQLKADPRPEDLAAAQASLDSARAQLEKLQSPPDEAEVEAARAALNAAQENLEKALASPSQFELDKAKRNLDQARNQLYAAQAQRDSTCGNPLTAQAQCEQAKAQVLSAEVSVDQAEAALEQLKTQPDDAAVASARSQVAQAESQLQHLLDGPSDADLAGARAQVRQAEAQLEKLRGGPREEELAAAEAQVDQARAGLRQAELALENGTIEASMAGTVAAVNVGVGELVSTAQPAVVLINTSAFKIDLAIDETDIGQIAVGQPASITLDAFPGETLPGEVAEISPAGTVQQGIVTYQVTVRPSQTPLELRSGMTAGVDITVAEKEDVLLVPNRAIRTQEGRRVVLVPRGEETVPVEVEIGLRNEQFVEVKSGLSEGDRVVTSVVPTNNPLEGGFFGNN